MNIQETTEAIRKLRKEMSITANYARRVRQADRLWDLEARYEMLLRKAGLEKP